MLLAHRFNSTAARDRAHYWLNRHGFQVTHSDLADAGSPRIAVCLPLSQMPAALALIDSIERADHDGEPGLPPTLQWIAHPAQAATAGHDVVRTPIHFGIALDGRSLADPQVDAIWACIDRYHE